MEVAPNFWIVYSSTSRSYFANNGLIFKIALIQDQQSSLIVVEGS